MAAAAGARNSVRQQAKRREAAAMKLREQDNFINGLFANFSADKESLNKKELGDLLATVNNNERPSQEEIDWIFATADMIDGKSDNALFGSAQLRIAVQAWQTYADNKETINAVMEKYDQDKSGKLEIGDFKMMLTDLNDGIPPTDEEVEAVMAKALRKHVDGQSTKMSTGDGVSRMEVSYAISVWYAHMEGKEGGMAAADVGCCTIS